MRDLNGKGETIKLLDENRRIFSYPEVEELVFSHFVICNDTQETLRFGQVDTDENILLASLHSHQYSWRSHKSPQVFKKQPYKHSNC